MTCSLVAVDRSSGSSYADRCSPDHGVINKSNDHLTIVLVTERFGYVLVVVADVAQTRTGILNGLHCGLLLVSNYAELRGASLRKCVVVNFAARV